ncbi:MAG: hypothetical protein ACREX6_09075, partial [Casimicrobiaceae bacterium]
GYMVRLSEEVENTLSPVARLIGHSFAAAFGFCGLGAAALLPILAVKLFLWLGFDELASSLRILEVGLLFADIVQFAVVFLSGVSVFSVETVVAAKRRIQTTISADSHDS